MDNLETVLQCLNEFEKAKEKCVGPELNGLLIHMAKTGRTEFPWHLLKPLITYKLEKVLDEYFENNPSANACSSEPSSKSRDLYPDAHKLIGKLDNFTGTPFTIQRLCELIIEPKKYYKTTAKFLRAVEKNIMVVSTVQLDGSLITRSLPAAVTNGDLSPKKTEPTQSCKMYLSITPVTNSPLNTINQDQLLKTTTPEDGQTEPQTTAKNPISLNKTQDENKDEKLESAEDAQCSKNGETVEENLVETSVRDTPKNSIGNDEKIVHTNEEVLVKSEAQTEEKTTSQEEKTTSQEEKTTSQEEKMEEC